MATELRETFRVVAPVETSPPIIDPPQIKPASFVADAKRLDGRGTDEFRPICK